MWKCLPAEFSERVLLTSQSGKQPAPLAASAWGWINATQSHDQPAHPALPSAKVPWGTGDCTWTLLFLHIVSHQHERGLGSRSSGNNIRRNNEPSGEGENFLIGRHMGLSQWQMDPKAPFPYYTASVTSTPPPGLSGLLDVEGWWVVREKGRRPLNQLKKGKPSWSWGTLFEC